MNIFVTNPDPSVSAQCLPDKHIVKMPLETCQMLSIVCSKEWGHDYGKIYRNDGQPYQTKKGAFRNHPCTIWANDTLENAWWLLTHGLALCAEYTHRYGKIHSCQRPLQETTHLLPSADHTKHTPFVFAGPDVYKHDKTIDIFTAYKYYIASKPWAASNYLRDPSRKPNWL
tara:strand:- start:440 stop:952 length:513 start_codon:yes stop_codon:yes gene_type:complete